MVKMVYVVCILAQQFIKSHFFFITSNEDMKFEIIKQIKMPFPLASPQMIFLSRNLTKYMPDMNKTPRK